jgi:hypothetical protein
VSASAVPTATVQQAPAQLYRAMGFRDLLLFYLPLMLTVLELSSRYPDEGGCYVRRKRAFGDFVPGRRDSVCHRKAQARMTEARS